MPVEDLSQRTETRQTFANPDGTWSTEIASGPERVQEEDGSWSDIDTTLEQGTDGGWVPQASAADVSFSDGGTGPFVTMAPADDSSFGLSWPEPLPAPVVDGSTLTYQDVVPNGDLVVQALPSGFSHSVVLRAVPTDPVDYGIPLELHGLQLVKQAGGALSVRTETGKEVVVAPEPVMFDNQTATTGEPVKVEPLQTTVDGTGADATLTLQPDMGMLTDPGTEYPVTIDPTFNEVTTGDTWLQNADFTTAQTGSTELRAGTYDGGGHKARSFIRFNIGALAGKQILDATLRLRNFHSNSCNLAGIRVNAIQQTWTAANMTWGNQPDVYPGNYDEFHQAYGATGCAANWATWDVTPIVRGWNNGTWINNGLRLKANDETNNSSWRKYRSANFTDPGVKPRLIVNYNSNPAAAGQPSVAPSSGGYATSLTPTFKAPLSDPDGGSVRGKFEVLVASTEEPIWNGTSPYVSSEETASVTVPANVLNDGSQYLVRVKANDGSLDSSTWSPTRTFTVNTGYDESAPATPSNTQVKTDTLTPLVSATLIGASPTSSVRMKVEVLDGSGTLVGTYLSEYVTSSESSFVEITGLPEGNYTVRVWADNGQKLSVFSADAGPVTVGPGTGEEPEAVLDSTWTPSTQEIAAATSESVVFTPDLPDGFSMELDASAGTVRVVNSLGTHVGSFVPFAFDNHEQLVPTSIDVSGRDLALTVSPTPAHVFPVRLGPIFEELP